jgi:predicted RND superfamily exporter protein
MKKISDLIIKYRFVIIGIFVIMCGVSLWGMTKIDINSDVLSYIPDDTETTEGQTVLYDNFNFRSNMAIAVDGDSISKNDLADKVEQIKAIEHVSNVSWIGDMEMIGFIAPENYEDIKTVFNKDGNYLLLLLLDVSSGDNAATDVVAGVENVLQGTTYQLGGTAAMNQSILETSLAELPIYLTVAVILVLIILILTSHSFVEPIIFITTLGISVLINMGTNFIFGPVSIITFCASGVLQLGLSMDYAIFLTHSYYEHRKTGLDAKEAVKKAIPQTFSTILSSALTTIGGFLALFLMRFTIGEDLGRVLAKGIILALLTVIVLQPCLLLILSKAIDKTQKKMLDFKFKGLANGSVKFRKVIIAIFLVALIPAYLGQASVNYSYLKFMISDEPESELQEYVNALSKQTYLVVPVTDPTFADQYQFLEELQAIEGVSAVSSIFTFVPETAINNQYFRSGILETSKNMLTEDYALYSISMNTGSVESMATQQVLSEIKSVSEANYGNAYYVTGVPQGISDFMAITPVDFRNITFVSILIILLILVINYRSFKYPIILIALIEFGIWINLAISGIAGTELNFVSYLIISAIQLGATIDYAILLTSKYRANRKAEMSPVDAAKKSSIEASMSILTSASIMIVACLSIGFIASFQVVREIALLIARGSLISCILVLCVLPGMLAASDSIMRKAKVEEKEPKDKGSSQKIKKDPVSLPTIGK